MVSDKWIFLKHAFTILTTGSSWSETKTQQENWSLVKNWSVNRTGLYFNLPLTKKIHAGECEYNLLKASKNSQANIMLTRLNICDKK